MTADEAASVVNSARLNYQRVRAKAATFKPVRPPQRHLPSSVLAALLAPIGPADPSKPAGPRVVLIDDCRDQVNFGANVLIDGLVAILQDRIPNATLVPVPSHWLMDTSSGFGAFLGNGEGLRQPWAPFPDVADQFDIVADDWLEGRNAGDAAQFLDRLSGADLVVLNGEGSIYRTNQSAVRELFLAWIAKERLGIPTVFLNGTIHLTDVVPLLPAMVRRTFASLDRVAVREAFSLRNLQEYAPDLEVEIFPDSAFAFDRNIALETPSVHAIRAKIGDSPYFCFDPGAMHMDHRIPHHSAVFELITALKRVAPTAVLVNSSPADGFIEEIAAETGSLYVDTISDYREYMALVRDAEFAVTGRYHNPILAAIVGTPSITFASANHKVHGACETLRGLVGTPYDGTYLRPRLDEIERHARRYVEQRDDYRLRLLEVCDRNRSDAFRMGDFAAGALRSTATNKSFGSETPGR